MSKTVTPKLNPTIVTKSKAKEVAAADGRKRPVVAINDEGKLVICCRRTAKTHGWTVQESLYERPKASKPAPVVEAPKPAPKKTKPVAVEILGQTHVIAPKKPSKKASVKADVKELLGE